MARFMEDDAPQGGQGEQTKNEHVTAKLTHIAGYSGKVDTFTAPKETLNQQGQKERRGNTEDGIPETLRVDFSKDLHGDLENLISLKKDLPEAEFKRLITEKNHRHYALLFDKFVKEVPGTNGRQWEIDEDAFDEYMHTDAGVGTAYLIRQRKLEEQALASAVLLKFNIPEAPAEMVAKQSVRVSRGKALYEFGRWFGRMWQEPIGRVNGRRPEGLKIDTKGKAILTVGGVAIPLGTIGGLVGGLGGFLGGGPLGALAGAAGGVGIAAGLAEGKHLLKPGQDIRIEQVAHALQTIVEDRSVNPPRTNTAEIRWMQQFYNIDPTDYEVTNDTVRLKPDKIQGTRIDAATLVKNLKGHADALLEYQKAQGVPEEMRTPMDTAWIFDGTRNPPQQGTKIEAKVLERFKELGGRVDTAGHPLEVRNRRTGLWEPLPPPPGGARLSPSPLRTEDNYRQAFEDVLCGQIESVFQGIVDGNTDYEQILIDEITAKQTARKGPDGELVQARIKPLETQLKNLGKDESTLQEQTKYLTSMQEKLTMLQQAQDQERSARQRVVVRTATSEFPASSVEAALAKALTDTTFGGFTIQIDGEPITSLAAQELAVKRQYLEDLRSISQNRPANVGGKTDYTSVNNEAIAAAKSYHDEQIAIIDKQKEKIKEVQDSLRKAVEAIQNTKKELADTEDISKNIEKIFQQRHIDFQELSSSVEPTLVGISEADLATHSFNDLLDRVNALHTQASSKIPPVQWGWEAEENEKSENRKKLLNAILEAKARRSEPRLFSRDAELHNILQAGINTNQLRQADVASLVDTLDAAETAGTFAWPDNISNASDVVSAKQIYIRTEIQPAAEANSTVLNDIVAAGVSENRIRIGDDPTQIVAELDAAETAGTFAWPTRIMVAAESKVATSQPMGTFFTRVINAGIDEQQLRELNTADLIARLDAAAATGTYTWPNSILSDPDQTAFKQNQINSIKAQAERRFSARREAVELEKQNYVTETLKPDAQARFAVRRNVTNEVLQDIQDRKKPLEEEQTKLSQEGLPLPALDTIARIAGGKKFNGDIEPGRYGKIREALETIDVSELFAEGIVDRSGNAQDNQRYLDVEDGKTKAYVQMMRLLFDHIHEEKAEYKGERGREAAFKRNAELISEDALRQELVTVLGLYTVPTPGAAPRLATTYQEALEVLKARINWLTPPPPYLPADATMLTRSDLGTFFTEHLIFKYLAPRVTTL